MKNKLILFAATLMLLSACTKEEEIEEVEQSCNCGVITEDEITTNADGSFCYSLEIRNDCSGNKKTWCFDYDVWLDGNLGESFCVTNVTSW
jgi:hypothetical protein